MFPCLFFFFVGVCRNCRVLLAKMESKEEPKAERKTTTEEFADDTEVLFPMGNLSLVSSQDQVEISFSSRVQKCRSA